MCSSLAAHFLGRACAEYRLPPASSDPGRAAALLAYPWTGNVRELANVMERVALLSEAPLVTAEHLSLAAGAASPRRRSSSPRPSLRDGSDAPVLAAAARQRASGRTWSRPSARRAATSRGRRPSSASPATRSGIAWPSTAWAVTSRSALRPRGADRPAAELADDAREPDGVDASARRRPCLRVSPRGERAVGGEVGTSSACVPPERAHPAAERRSGLVQPEPRDRDLAEKIQTFGGRIEEMSPTGIVRPSAWSRSRTRRSGRPLAATAAHKARGARQ